jgi:pimeloyl-ACP methyl ester carboxylesterase
MTERSLTLDIGPVTLEGTLTVPSRARGLIVLAQESRPTPSPGNRFVVTTLDQGALATLCFDLVTGEEDERDARTAEVRFDVYLLADRLLAVSDWARAQPELASLPLGYFVSSTGAAAALIAAARRPELVAAVVSRSGRPDLGGSNLDHVYAPTQLIVGGNDEVLVELNRDALRRLRCEAELRIVPGVTQLFAERRAREWVASLAYDWFAQHLSAPPRPAYPNP